MREREQRKRKTEEERERIDRNEERKSIYTCVCKSFSYYGLIHFKVCSFPKNVIA